VRARALYVTGNGERRGSHPHPYPSPWKGEGSRTPLLLFSRPTLTVIRIYAASKAATRLLISARVRFSVTATRKQSS